MKKCLRRGEDFNWDCDCGKKFGSLKAVMVHQRKKICTAMKVDFGSAEAVGDLKAQIADLKARIKFANGPASPAQKRRVLDLRVKDWR